MKQRFSILLIALVAAPLFAQADAVALAAQREQEENMKRLSATILEVQEAHQKQQERISGLANEVDKLRSDVVKANNNAATQEALKRLNDQILEVDKSRIADNKKIYAALEDLKRLILDRPAPPAPKPVLPPPSGNTGVSGNSGGSTSRPPATGSLTEEGFEYIIQRDDTLSHVVTAYQKQGIKVTQKQVMEANPNVNWNRLRVGTKIFIPKPK